MLAATTLAITAISCSKANNPECEISTITLKIEQPTDDSISKTVIGTKTPAGIYPINWSENDLIAVSSQTASSYAKYKLSAGAGSTTGTFTKKSGTTPSGTVYAFYPYDDVNSVSSNTYNVTIPDTQIYIADSFGSGAMPMFASADAVGSLQTMKPLMSVLKINLKGSCKVKSILLQSSSVNLSGSATVDMTSGTVSFTEGKKYVLLTSEDGVQLSETTATAFYIVVPATAEAVNFTVTIKDDKGYLMQKNLSTKKFTAKVIKNVNSALNVSTSCLLPGEFSVSESKKIKFTSGNLYKDADEGEDIFHMETSQEAYPDGWNANHIVHFYWTKDASKSYAEAYDDDPCTVNDKFFADGSEDHTITIDGQSELYTLSKEEWDYLIDEYEIKNNVTINNVTGCMVLAPDTFEESIEDTYDYANWASAEACGLICLPPAGYRSGTEIVIESYGLYWSSTPYENNAVGAHYLIFSNTENPTIDTNPRNTGSSIRLVSTISN